MKDVQLMSDDYAYLEKTAQSRIFLEEAKKVMPGGVTANIKYFQPHPIVMSKATGPYVYDLDGNEYVDYLLSYGALMLGHGHPDVMKAIRSQLEQDGTMLFGAPHQLEITMGQRIQKHYPSMGSLRYTNSGTEATLLALRLARGFTGKASMAKFEGHYHGGYDEVLVSVNPNIEQAGPSEQPYSISESLGITNEQLAKTFVLPFNDLESCEKILTKHQDEIGAVMIEPFQAGFIRASHEFMHGLQSLTKKLGMVLIFDEVKTGFRIALGGAQQYYGIKPDLTALGKVIGGGFPFGIVGGKQEIMNTSAPIQSADVFDVSQSGQSKASEVLFHSGTYNGHPTILAAGIKTLDVLESEAQQVYDYTNELKNELQKLFSKYAIPLLIEGEGSIFNLMITEQKKLTNYRDMQAVDTSMRKRIDMKLLLEGIYTKPLNRYSISTAHTDLELYKTVKAFDRVLKKI